MGKPFAGELDAFAGTYNWALAEPVGDLAGWLRSSSRLPLVAVGSGGSFTSAAYASFLHTLFTGRLAKIVTPFEFTSSPLHLPDVAVLLLTAGGGNPDILACLDRVQGLPPRLLGGVCTRKGSALGEAIKSLEGHSLHEYELPTGKDGFLATNSLIATAVLLTRAWNAAWDNDASLPASLADLVHPGTEEPTFREALAGRCRHLWDRGTTVVLHGHATQAAAIDLESKFTEAAIGHLQLADYRNFAHGRHHWLARHGDDTGVLAFVTPEDRPLAERTLRLLPGEIPVTTVELDQPAVANGIASIVVGMLISGLAGVARGIDPGRPTVPQFGRRLYHLGGLGPPRLSAPDLTVREAAAIERKAAVGVVTLAARGELDAWRTAYAAFCRSLKEAPFSAAVFDYDGTLCGAGERRSGPGSEVKKLLRSLIDAGILIGIATGRGKSVRKDLRKVLPDRGRWDRVLVGYHNGGEVAWLSDDSQPPETDELHDSLRDLDLAFRAEPGISTAVKVEAKLRQITLELSEGSDPDRVWELADRVARQRGVPGVTLVRSSHSIDALAPGVSKRLLVARVRTELEQAKQTGAVLCVGDRGRWPGNDHELLQERYSLSVDEVSGDPATCWNIAPPGVRCVDAVLAYLRLARIGAGQFTLHT